MLCFRGRCYPAGAETTASTELTKPKKNFFNEGQRADLKRKMIDRYSKQFGSENKVAISQEVEHFFADGREINSSSIFSLQNTLKQKYAKGGDPNSKRTLSMESQRQGKNPYTSSGATADPYQPAITHSITQPADANPPKKAKSRSSSSSSSRSSSSDKEKSKLPPLSRKTLMNVQPIAWATDEEKWGTIYKYNAYVYKQEQRLDRLRQQHKQMAVKQQLEEQVREKERQKQREKEQQISFLTLNKQLKDLEKQNDLMKDDHKKAKVVYEREMRQQQMAENKSKRDREIKAEKDREALTKMKIKEELQKEKEEAEDLKRKKLEEMRRVMAENEDRKAVMAEIKERERLQDVELQKKTAEIAEELERQRQAELKSKSDRIQNIIKRYGWLNQFGGSRQHYEEETNGARLPQQALPRAEGQDSLRERAQEQTGRT